MDLIYIPKCHPFNFLSDGIFYLVIRAFVCELQVEMYLTRAASSKKRISVLHKVLDRYFRGCYFYNATQSLVGNVFLLLFLVITQ